MPRFMRSILVALLVAMLAISPATACHYCGGYGGYYYSSGGYYGGCCAPTYYDSSYGSCCGGEVVVSDGCGDCGGCGGCGCDGCDGRESEGVVEDHDAVPMEAPEPPMEPQTTPSTVNRMPSEPAPSLPPQETHTAPPMETYATPPAAPATEPAPLPETTTPPVTTPAVEPSTPAVEPAAPATEPATDDLFSTPSTDSAPLPVEEPATPSEAGAADDLFSEPETPPATESDPLSEPATPAAEPTDDDLFAPPADETPTEEETPPAEESTETDDLFSRADAILHQPGGLSSHSLRHWVDNTGKFSCNGRMLRMLDGKVQLLKDNGRTTTVPLARLSKGDLEFVNRQASAQKSEALGKTAQATSAWSK